MADSLPTLYLPHQGCLAASLKSCKKTISARGHLSSVRAASHNYGEVIEWDGIGLTEERVILNAFEVHFRRHDKICGWYAMVPTREQLFSQKVH
jgi:hypothetical protein